MPNGMLCLQLYRIFVYTLYLLLAHIVLPTILANDAHLHVVTEDFGCIGIYPLEASRRSLKRFQNQMSVERPIWSMTSLSLS